MSATRPTLGNSGNRKRRCSYLGLIKRTLNPPGDLCELWSILLGDGPYLLRCPVELHSTPVVLSSGDGWGRRGMGLGGHRHCNFGSDPPVHLGGRSRNNVPHAVRAVLIGSRSAVLMALYVGVVGAAGHDRQPGSALSHSLGRRLGLSPTGSLPISVPGGGDHARNHGRYRRWSWSVSPCAISVGLPALWIAARRLTVNRPTYTGFCRFSSIEFKNIRPILT